ncbi:hypothetical protein H7H51_04180 [Mycolicibacterium farcinogenes]|nr:hypothetical protein [Mycolicibacterium farcinogenes]
MTLSTGLWSSSAATLQRSPEREAMRRCAACCRSLDPVELALPAAALRDNNVAKWARDHGLAVAVGNSPDLAVAIGTGIHPMRLVVHANGFSGDELVFCSANLGVGRVVASSVEQIDLLTSCAVRHRRQRVILAGSDNDAVTAVLNGPRLDLVGMYREIDGGATISPELPRWSVTWLRRWPTSTVRTAWCSPGCSSAARTSTWQWDQTICRGSPRPSR